MDGETAGETAIPTAAASGTTDELVAIKTAPEESARER